MDLLIGAFVWLFASFAVMVLAERWGRSGGGYLLGSIFFSPLLVGLFLVVEGERLGRCVHCASKIQLGAAICPFCHLSPYPPAPPIMRTDPATWTPPPVAPPLPPLPGWASAAPPASPPRPAPASTTLPRKLARAHVALLVAGALAMVSAVVGTVVYFTSDPDPPVRARPARRHR